MKHQTSKGDQMQASKRGWKSLVITHQAAKTGGLSKRALHDPSARQEHKAPFDESSLDDFQAYAVFFSRLCRRVAGIALVNKGL